MKVPFFDYPLQYKSHESEYQKLINRVLSDGAYILGEDVERFEANLAKFTGAKYAVGVDNCTDALLLSLYASGIGPNDEVITVSHTFVATVEIIRLLKAVPVFVDIADDHNMDVKLVENAITSKTKAIIPVHLNGRVCDGMDRLIDIANKYKLTVIEDAAQSLGARYKKKKAGTFGKAGCFSFYPAKLLGAFGDAGAIITNDREFAKRLRMMRNHGRGKGAYVELWGLNSRMDNLHAAILDHKLTKYLPRWIERRRKIAHMYNKGLSSLSALRLPPPPDAETDNYDVFQNYEIEAMHRNELMDYLKKHEIHTSLPWGGTGVHQFTPLGLTDWHLPRTEEMFSKVLMLPMFPELKDDAINYVIDTIHQFYDKHLQH